MYFVVLFCPVLFKLIDVDVENYEWAILYTCRHVQPDATCATSDEYLSIISRSRDFDANIRHMSHVYDVITTRTCVDVYQLSKPELEGNVKYNYVPDYSLFIFGCRVSGSCLQPGDRSPRSEALCRIPVCAECPNGYRRNEAGCLTCDCL